MIDRTINPLPTVLKNKSSLKKSKFKKIKPVDKING